MTPYEQLIAHIKDNGGVLTADPVVDGKWHNIPAEDGKKGNKSFGYIAYRNMDGSIGGKITNYYRSDESESFIFTEEKHQQRPARQIIADQQTQRQEDAARQEQERVRAAQRAAYVYKMLPAAPADHPYLVRKQVDPYMAKINQSGQLVIPMINANGQIQSLEFIGNNGFKKIMPGTKAAGAFTPLGFPRGESPPQILIAEGFATAASLHASTGIPTIHARGKGNIAAVTSIMQERHPSASLIIAADNDQGKTNNYGLATAKAIQAENPDVIIMLPPINGDYNDLAAMPNGKARIRTQFADIAQNQYITETRAEALLSAGKFDTLRRAAETGNIDLTPALARKLLEASNQDFANHMMRIALNDASPQVREAAAAVLAKANEGGIGADYRDISMADIETIRHDASPISSLAAEQTALDKRGVDLPDYISTLITSWRQEIERRKEELGLNDVQVAQLSSMFEKNIIANQDKPMRSPADVSAAVQRQPQKQKEKSYEPGN